MPSWTENGAEAWLLVFIEAVLDIASVKKELVSITETMTDKNRRKSERTIRHRCMGK